MLAGRDEGYVPFYDEYLDEVKDGKKPEVAISARDGRCRRATERAEIAGP